MWIILIKYNGEWGVWSRGYETRQEADDALDFWQERLSWQLKIGKE